MANLATRGYYITGINNVNVRLYPQVLGIYKIHEHNLCNALRDFGLIIKSDSRRSLLNYNYDFLKFLQVMRPSEVCMIAHGYSLLKLDDRNWWNSFTSISSQLLYDIDGKEIAGLLYSLTRVYSQKNNLIERLIDESKSWINLATPTSLSLLVKVATHFNCGPEIMKMLNLRSLQLIDDLKIVDIVFFLTSNVESKTHDINFFRQMCLRIIEIIDEVDLHHLRAIAASISMGGFKSHIMFNVLTIRLSQIASSKNLTESDVISILLAFTTQKFLAHNDLSIDSKTYKRFLKENPTSSNDIFTFPLPEFGHVMSESVYRNKDRITSNGLPIVFRAISILKIPIDEDFFNHLLARTCNHIEQDLYKGLKLSNLVVTFVKFNRDNSAFWKAIYGTLTRQNDLQLTGDLVSKMINTISTIEPGSLSDSKYLDMVRTTLIKNCENYASSMSARSLLALNRHFSLTKQTEILCSDEFIDAIINKMDDFSLSDLTKILKSYTNLNKSNINKEKIDIMATKAEERINMENYPKGSNNLELTNLIQNLKSGTINTT
ncbi:hypothetical protein TpMuguga_02g02130 [Theileria parva strain Muguga]|uniref:uncharacterized protein n=1 Tax=Theileria parva strain Muguga TaxID=333668 RepID=UPI001C618090|nr:uncharacterized protein TpMuguga_02g02130 [Theileria parva strain Muguga]KAF5153617.1 hypothetical protein TpMuguga_02g02130 [Theileria parva strain Muguga]